MTSLSQRFQIVRSLRVHKTEQVFIANDLVLEQPHVVLRVFQRGLFKSHPEQLCSFLSWHQGTHHPHLARILESGISATNEAFYIREYIQSSGDIFNENSRWLKPLLATVRFLHLQGMVHGAIKPSNVFIQNGILKLVDPKLCPELDLNAEDIRHTAPEVLAGERPTFASDLYSVGALLYRAFSLRDPFDDFDVANLKAKYMWGSPKPLIDVCHVSKSLSDIVGRLLDRSPNARTGAFEEALVTFEVQPIGANRAAYVGRESHLRTIQLTTEKTSSPGLKVFLVDGQPGIGKTRFLEELRLRANLCAANFEIISCQKGTDFKAVVRAIGRILQRRLLKKGCNVDNELGGFAPTLSDLLVNENAGYRTNQFPLERVINDLVGFVARFSRRERLVLAVDNAEHADGTTREFIEMLCFRAAEIPASLVLTTSVANSDCLSKVAVDCLRESLLPIHLKDLRLEDAQKLIDSFACNPTWTTRILQWSAGHPLLIEQYATTPDFASKTARNINSFVSRLLTNLTKDVLSTAQTISLFDKPVPIDVIAQINCVSNLQARLQTLTEGAIVEQREGCVYIKYACVRRKLFSDISRKRKVRLHVLAYTALKERSAAPETLASFALRAGFFGVAFELFEDIACKAHEAGDFSKAATFFQIAEKCARKIGQQISDFDRFKLARCYDRIGHQARAREIYEKLLSQAPPVDPVLISSICAEMSGPFQTRKNWNRIRLCTHAISVLPKDSPELIQAHLRLTFALIWNGELKLAREALITADAINRRLSNPKDLRTAWAFLYGHEGDFKNAWKCLEPLAESADPSPKVLNNMAYYLEQLGNLKLAKETQTAALSLATATGYAPIKVVSLGNLACMETKLGSFVEASRLFTLAFETVARLAARDGEFAEQAFASVLADAARFAIDTSDYTTASQYLKKISPDTESRYEAHNVHIDLVRCELALCLGRVTKAKNILCAMRQTKTGKIDFFRIEQLMLKARLTSSTSRKIVVLKGAVELAENLGTLHHYCRAVNDLADVFIQSGQISEARPLIMKTFEIAQEHGYRPVLARTVLLRALTAQTSEQKFADLFRAFYMASEMGLTRLAAEIAFFIGNCQLEIGNRIAAQEYLKRSVSLVDSIVEQLPRSSRRDYVAKSFRGRATSLLEELIKTNPASVDRHHIENSDVGNAFRAIYRLSTSVGLITEIETLLDLLTQTFEDFLSRPAIVMIETPKGPIWRSLRIKLTDETSTRVRSLSQKAGDRIYFGSGGSTHAKDTVAWIPLVASEYRGGIYVTCLPGEAPFSEREMEFLTVVGVIANRTLDQLCHRRQQQVHTAKVQEFQGIIGASKAIREVYSHIEIAAGNTATVLIEGESGTGKELVAKAIHQTSARAKGPFIAVDCGAIPDTLIEAELFGAKKGAYTDAVADRPGLFEVADRGTIFLDEIANTTPAVQAKLLRVLQEREVRRIGEAKGRNVDVRLIAATNGNLESLAKEGRFRKDLLYRLKVLHITVPPLRHRRDDISMLVHAFLDRLNAANRTKKTFAPGVTAELLTHPFPGNVRELQNAVERAFFVTKGAKINRIALESGEPPAINTEVQSWFQEIVDGRKNFWSHVHDRYKKRDIPREKVIALVDFGLKSTHGSYKSMASMFNLKGPDYRRFMDFLRRNRCLLDFRPYRQAATDLS